MKNNYLGVILVSFFHFLFFCIFIKKIIFFHNYFFLFFRGELYKSIKREILSCEREKGRERLHYEFFFLMWLCTMKRKEKNKEIFEKNDWVNKNYYFFWNENLFLISDNTYLISFLFCFVFHFEREREREECSSFFQCHFIKRDNTYLSILLLFLFWMIFFVKKYFFVFCCYWSVYFSSSVH